MRRGRDEKEQEEKQDEEDRQRNIKKAPKMKQCRGTHGAQAHT
jgi:hypothetical protein